MYRCQISRKECGGLVTRKECVFFRGRADFVFCLRSESLFGIMALSLVVYGLPRPHEYVEVRFLCLALLLLCATCSKGVEVQY